MPFPINGDQLTALSSGNSMEWDAFFNEIDPLIRKTVSWRKWRFDMSTQEDVAQNIRLSVYKAITKPDSELSYINEGLIKSIAVNRCLDEVRRQIRKKKREQLTSEDHLFERLDWDDFDPHKFIIRQEQIHTARSLLKEMGNSCQESIIRFYHEGQSYKEIAEAFDISQSTVGSRLQRCLKKIRDLWRQADAGAAPQAG